MVRNRFIFWNGEEEKDKTRRGKERRQEKGKGSGSAVGVGKSRTRPAGKQEKELVSGELKSPFQHWRELKRGHWDSGFFMDRGRWRKKRPEAALIKFSAMGSQKRE